MKGFRLKGLTQAKFLKTFLQKSPTRAPRVQNGENGQFSD